MKNRNKKIEQLVYSAVNDFTRIAHLSLTIVEGAWVINVKGRRTVTLSRFFEKDKFFVHFICHLEKILNLIEHLH